MNNIAETVAVFVRKYRKKREMTQEELAEKCGLHPTYIAKIESGRQVCSLKTLSRLADALSVSPHALLGQIDKKQAAVYQFQNEHLRDILEKGNKSDKEMLFAVAETLIKKRKKSKS
ncbi:helix-turn-helix transcriptional regulator [bacterium]|nr:helix-turn-helix transcriptional regulator [Candidatus Omnitrophota bacterium]MBU2527813.1 helix-turn-helix transcriptional regulator [bacterium]MBU3930728.1 helix-turn-helix transcriptional regulator [bacterium]MBU4122056.1 helix-turn-helix transcriptional regulator [bacterium]